MKSFQHLANLKNFNLCVFHPIWVKFVVEGGGEWEVGGESGVTVGKEKHRISSYPTDQPKSNLFNFCVFSLILIKFGLGS